MKGWGSAVSVLAIVSFVVLAIIGYVLNIIAIFGLRELDVEAVLRIIGIFVVPLGSLFGWFLQWT